MLPHARHPPHASLVALLAFSMTHMLPTRCSTKAATVLLHLHASPAPCIDCLTFLLVPLPHPANSRLAATAPSRLALLLSPAIHALAHSRHSAAPRMLHDCKLPAPMPSCLTLTTAQARSVPTDTCTTHTPTQRTTSACTSHTSPPHSSTTPLALRRRYHPPQVRALPCLAAHRIRTPLTPASTPHGQRYTPRTTTFTPAYICTNHYFPLTSCGLQPWIRA